jgi:hypothetical protein
MIVRQIHQTMQTIVLKYDPNLADLKLELDRVEEKQGKKKLCVIRRVDRRPN